MVDLERMKQACLHWTSLTHLEVAMMAFEAINQRELAFAGAMPSVGIG
jgi:hypothetical protein